MYIFLFLEKYFLRFLRIQLPRHFFAKADTIKHVMPQQNPRHLPTAEANFEC